MPRQPNNRTARPASSTRAGSTTTRRPNGNGNGRRNNRAAYWPMELSLAGGLELVVEGQNGDSIGIAVCSLCAAILPGSEVSQRFAHRLARDHLGDRWTLMAIILLVGRALEEPRLKIVRAIPWGDGFRYLIAEGAASPELYLSAFKDTCATFPDYPVLVVADWGNHCEVLDAQHYTALRPVLGRHPPKKTGGGRSRTPAGRRSGC